MNSIIQNYESRFAQHLGIDKAFSFWKGRIALYAILKALDIGQGDNVILPGYTCVMNVNPIKYLGANPVYVDINSNTFNINTKLLKDKIIDATKVIIAQHTYGYPCDMDEILAIANKHRVMVIEDCCLAFGSKYKGKTVGTFGKAAYFSSQWNKPFTTGLGGMAVTNDKELADKIEQLCQKEMCKPNFKEAFMLAVQLCVYRTLIYPRTTALAQSLFRWLTKKGIVIGSSSMCEFEPVMADNFFKGISYIQAKSGLRQLAKIDGNISHRKEMAKIYDELLSEKGWTSRKYDASIMDPVMVRYPVRITEKKKALEEAASAGIELGSWFECPLHPIETKMDMYDYEIGMCPEAERAAKEVVNLPLHTRTNKRTAEETADFVTRFTQSG